MGVSKTFSCLSLALLLGLSLELVCPSESASVYPREETRREAVENSTDPVWRMVAGGQTASSYMFYKQAVAFEEEPLVTVNESSSSQELLQSVLDGVCDLLSIYDLLSRVDNCSDLYLLLTQNMVDSCTWLNYLVNNTLNVTGSEDFHHLNETCAPESPMPRLRHYCLQMKVREPGQLRHLMQRTINDGLSTYYPTAVTEEDRCRWLETSVVFADEARDRVEVGANLFCSF